MKAYSYIRFSSEKQRGNDSERRQLSKTAEVCREHGWQLDDTVYADRACSGYDGSNLLAGSDLYKFRCLVESGDITTPCVLIIESPDRLTRQKPMLAVELWSSLINRGVSVYTHVPKILHTPDNVEGLQLAIGQLIRAWEESHTKSVRVRDAQAEKLRTVGRVSNKSPNWIDGETWTVNQQKQAVIKRIFTDCINGMGIDSITKQLNREHVPIISKQKKARGKKTLSGNWSAGYVAKILRNKQLLGCKNPSGISQADYFPRCIDDDVFYLAQNAMTSRKKVSGPRSKEGNLFQGLLTEARTKTPMVKTGRGYLVCQAGLQGTGDWVSVNYQYLERAFFAFAKEITITQSRPASKIPALEAQLAEVHANLEQLQAALLRKYSPTIEQAIHQQEHQLQALGQAIDAQKALERDNAQEAHQTILQAIQSGADRLLIKQAISNMVQEMWLVNVRIDGKKITLVQVYLKTGLTKILAIGLKHAIGGTQGKGVDFRQWQHDDVFLGIDDLEANLGDIVCYNTK